MKFKDCLASAIVVSAPMTRSSPDKSWLDVHTKKIIPDSLYKFYVMADYLSFDKCPGFLADDQRIVFSHLGASIELIKYSFEDYHELLSLMNEYDAGIYNPIKRLKKEPFDHDAPKRFNRCFQLLLINMYSILDASAEAISAVLLWGNFGKASFADIVKQISDDSKKAISASGERAIISIDEKYREDITNLIKNEIIDVANNEWFELFKLYRNKMAHFRYYSSVLFHDKDEKFYHFLPRRWPYYFQQDITYGKPTDNDINAHLTELLMECDIFEYSEGLHKKIYDLTEKIFQSLTEAYGIKKVSICQLDSNLRDEVKSLTRRYKFKHF